MKEKPHASWTDFKVVIESEPVNGLFYCVLELEQSNDQTKKFFGYIEIDGTLGTGELSLPFSNSKKELKDSEIQPNDFFTRIAIWNRKIIRREPSGKVCESDLILEDLKIARRKLGMTFGTRYEDGNSGAIIVYFKSQSSFLGTKSDEEAVEEFIIKLTSKLPEGSKISPPTPKSN